MNFEKASEARVYIRLIGLCSWTFNIRVKVKLLKKMLFSNDWNQNKSLSNHDIKKNPQKVFFFLYILYRCYFKSKKIFC